MLPLLPDRPRRRREGRIRERAYRDGHNSRRGLRGVEDGRAAVRTEVEEGAFVSLVRDADVLPRGALGRYLFCVESRLDTEDASSSTLAGETVADRDSNRLSLDGEPELPTTTRGVSSAHERIVDRVGSGTFPEHWPRRGHGFDVERLGCAATETIKRPDNSASQPTSGADHRRLRADPRRGWARRRRGSRGPLARPRSLATYRAGRAPRPTP